MALAAIQVAVGNWLCAQTPGHLKGPEKFPGFKRRQFMLPENYNPGIGLKGQKLQVSPKMKPP